MFNWFNMKKKSLPQQVLENTKDIEKLYDQELSDITQLNYKQDAEDSLTYADGKATFKGKMSIIRNENTQNLVVDSDIEVNISSGDDDIIIDAGEDNVSLKIRLDNETRNKINRALLTPITTPITKQVVMINTNNAEQLEDENYFVKSSRLKENFIQSRWVGGDYAITSFGSTQINIQENTQSGDIFSIENGQFKCLKSGYYKVNVTIPLNVTNNHVYGLMIKQNNVVIDNHWFYVNSYHTYSTSVITYLSENDMLSFSVYNESGSEATVKIPTNLGGYGRGTINITSIKGVE